MHDRSASKENTTPIQKPVSLIKSNVVSFSSDQIGGGLSK